MQEIDLFGDLVPIKEQNPVKRKETAKAGLLEVPEIPYVPYSVVRVSKTAVWVLNSTPTSAV